MFTCKIRKISRISSTILLVDFQVRVLNFLSTETNIHCTKIYTAILSYTLTHAFVSIIQEWNGD